MSIAEGQLDREALEPKPSMSLGMLGMILILVSIGAFFIALAVAYYFALLDRPGRPVQRISHWFWISTALIAVSSVLLQWARRELRLARFVLYRKYLRATLGIGMVFLIAQVLGCRELSLQGVFEPGNARVSMFYMFSGVHGLHLLGGLGGIYWLLRKADALRDGEEQPLRRHRSAARNVAVYWHFMGVLWAGLFICLLVWR